MSHSCEVGCQFCYSLCLCLNMSEGPKESEPNNNEEEVPGAWMIRPCASYDEEYSDCVSIRARFNQYFIFGETIDCNQWKKDSVNCYKWEKSRDVDAANEIIRSERKRREARLLAHYGNDVWKKRKGPPPDWNKPLPEDMQKEYENSYLNIKSKQIKGELPKTFDTADSKCSIM